MCDVLQVNTSDEPFGKGLSGDEAAFYETQIWNWPTQITHNKHQNRFPAIQTVFYTYIQLCQIIAFGFIVELGRSTNTDPNTDRSLLIGPFINGSLKDCP
jgi:hypothetical protein